MGEAPWASAAHTSCSNQETSPCSFFKNAGQEHWHQLLWIRVVPIFWTLGQEHSLLCIILPLPLLPSDATSIPPERGVSPSEQALSGLRCAAESLPLQESSTENLPLRLNWKHLLCPQAHRQYVAHTGLPRGSWLGSVLQSEHGQLLLYWVSSCQCCLFVPGLSLAGNITKTGLGLVSSLMVWTTCTLCTFCDGKALSFLDQMVQRSLSTSENYTQ